MICIIESINVVLIGNPNVGKSTLFNSLTRQHQHTGNWTGKTVSVAKGECKADNIDIHFTDLPGTYSLVSDSPEEKVTTDCIMNGNYDVAVIVINSTALKRNLFLTLQVLMHTQNVLLCLNMADEARKKGVVIDKDELRLQLGIPVVEIIANKAKNIDKLIKTIVDVHSGKEKYFIPKSLKELGNSVISYEEKANALNRMSEDISLLCLKNEGCAYTKKDAILDRLFTSKIIGIPIMLVIFGVVFWITAFGANYPSELLMVLFNTVIDGVSTLLTDLNVNMIISDLITSGVLTTVGWVVSVMLPPALIFFILFALLEDTGYLPRIAFNLDRLFSRSGANGKLALTMLMGFGCNACGVMGCRIIKTKHERLVGTITNSFIPCNGRLPTLIAVSSIFFTATLSGIAKSIAITAILLCIFIFSVAITLLCSFALSKTVLKGESSTFVLELPPYRKPQFLKVIVKSIREKVMYVLSRAVLVSVPAGAIIWGLTNIEINSYPTIKYLADFFEPLGSFAGLDGVIITAFLLGFPANEIVLPIIFMVYMGNNTLMEYSSIANLGILLVSNSWDVATAICFCVMCLFHYPCSTTCFAIHKETKSVKWTIASILLPLCIGISLCAAVNMIFMIFS